MSETNEITTAPTTGQAQGTPSTNPWSGEASPQYDLTPKTEVKPAAQQPPATAPAAAPAPSALMDEKTLRTIVQETAKAVQPAPAEKQMSTEEFNRLMNVFHVTPELTQKLGLAPEVADVLHDMLQSVAKQAVTMSEFRIRAIEQQLRQQYDQRLTPIQSYVAAQEEKAYRKEFFELNKDLVGWEPILETTYAQLKNEGKQFESKEAAYKEIAARARAIIKSIPVTASGEPTATPTSNAPTGHKMSTLTGGGQGGAGGTKPAAPSQAKSIFG